MTQELLRRWMACAVLASWLGCSPSGRFEEVPDAGATLVVSAPPRGSSACQKWQDAFCDFLSDRCGIVPRALCDEQQQGVECRSDEVALDCTERFETAPCQLPPMGCEVADVADRRPAIESCETYFHALCESNVRCELFADVDSCLAHPLFQIDCDRALSVSVRYEACLETLELRACDTQVPLCDDIIRGM